MDSKSTLNKITEILDEEVNDKEECLRDIVEHSKLTNAEIGRIAVLSPHLILEERGAIK